MTMKYAGQIKLAVCLLTVIQVLGCMDAQAADGLLKRRSGHPYLTYSDANIANLKERINNEPVIAAAWEKMLADADRMVGSSGNEGGRRRRVLNVRYYFH